MPIYEYPCERCNEIFEYREKIDAPKTRSCVECGDPLYRKFSVANLASGSSSLDIHSHIDDKIAEGEPATHNELIKMCHHLEKLGANSPKDK